MQSIPNSNVPLLARDLANGTYYLCDQQKKLKKTQVNTNLAFLSTPGVVCFTITINLILGTLLTVYYCHTTVYEFFVIFKPMELFLFEKLPNRKLNK